MSGKLNHLAITTDHYATIGMFYRAVFGMKGRAGGRKAFMTGETNSDYQTSAAYLSKVVPLVEEGSAIPIMSWGSLDDDGNLILHRVYIVAAGVMSATLFLIRG